MGVSWGLWTPSTDSRPSQAVRRSSCLAGVPVSAPGAPGLRVTHLPLDWRALPPPLHKGPPVWRGGRGDIIFFGSREWRFSIVSLAPVTLGSDKSGEALSGRRMLSNRKRCLWVQSQEIRQRLPCAPLSRPAAFTAPAPGSLDAPWSLKAPGEPVPVQDPAPALELMPRYPQTS